MEELIKKNFDKSLLSTTETHETFVNNSKYDLETEINTRERWGLFFYINESIPCKIINNEDIPNDMEKIFFIF